MPPPPPPSKSYLLVLDTDSEDDDQDASIRRHSSAARVMLPNDVTRVPVGGSKEQVFLDLDANNPTTVIPTHSIPASPAQQQQQRCASLVMPLTKSFQEANLISPIKVHDQDDNNDRCDNELEEDQDQTHAESLGSSSSPQRFSLQASSSSPSKPFGATNSNINNKKRRRRRHRGTNKTLAATTTNNKKKNVTFGTVQIRRFERTLGGDGVPADGGWPLGLGSIIPFDESNNDNSEEPPIPVHEYDERVQQELQLRWRALYSGDLQQELQPPAILETRQWDYKKERNQRGNSIRNPLFGSLTEDQRNNLLIHGTVTSSKCPPVSSVANNNKKKNSNTNQGRPRANSIDQHSSRGGTSTITTRSGGNGNGNNSGRTRSQSVDYFNAGPFDPIHVRHVRKELEDLRHARSKSDEGCSCRKLQVNSKKMSASKVREELRKRHALPTSTSSPNNHTATATAPTRLELEELLRRLVEEEPCCSSQNDCPCVKYGLGCQADACSCWNHRGDEKPKTVLEIKERCRNKFGMYVVDFEYIDRYRKSLLCEVITAESS